MALLVTLSIIKFAKSLIKFQISSGAIFDQTIDDFQKQADSPHDHDIFPI